MISAPLKIDSKTALLAIVLFASACRGKHHSTAAVQNEEPDATPRIASALKMSDPRASTQLLKGFYGVESGAWRWTAGKFSVLLRSPLGAAQRGGTLTFAFTIPDVTIQKLHEITLTAAIGPTVLKSRTYSAPGSYTFSADVPATQLTAETVTIDFTLDKALPPGSGDSRELGLVAMSAGLESK
jgi:hypothetical protein